MIKQLSDLVRHRTHGTLDLHVEPFDLVALAHGAVQEACASTSAHEVHLKSNSAEIRIVADAERLRRVFDNLLGNAIKYSPAGGHIGSRWSGAIAGSGLGLSFCQSAISAHGGQLIVDSTHGVGTTVTVYLPLAPVGTAPLNGHADGGLPQAGIQEVR